MFFDSTDEIVKIAKNCGTAIFVMPSDIEFNIKNAIILKPEEKSVITIEQVREAISKLSTKQISDQYIIIRPADLMNEQSANAMLKNLEEPGDKVHFVMITEQPSKLLATIVSRANVYFLRQDFDLKKISTTDEKKKNLAKRLIAAKPSDLYTLAQEITSKKDQVRSSTLDILAIAIEMLYKTYFLSNKDVFLKKIPKFLKAYESISKNGNIKLHLVADLC